MAPLSHRLTRVVLTSDFDLAAGLERIVTGGTTVPPTAEDQIEL